MDLLIVWSINHNIFFLRVEVGWVWYEFISLAYVIISLGNEFKSIHGKEEAYCIMETGIKGICLFRKTVSLYF